MSPPAPGRSLDWLLDVMIRGGHRVARRMLTSTRSSAAERVDVSGHDVVLRRYSQPEVPGPAPLIVGLHGFGSDERQLETLVPLSEDVRAASDYLGLRGGCGPVGRIAVPAGGSQQWPPGIPRGIGPCTPRQYWPSPVVPE